MTGQPDETRSDDEIRRETVALARTERPTPGEIGRLQSHALLLLADRARLVEENAELRAKLELPCGSCHPCNNWSDETWRRAGRKPPHVHEWDAARAEVTRLRQAVERIREAADGVIVTRQGGDFDSVSHVKLLRLIDAIIAAGGA